MHCPLRLRSTLVLQSHWRLCRFWHFSFSSSILQCGISASHKVLEWHLEQDVLICCSECFLVFTIGQNEVEQGRFLRSPIRHPLKTHRWWTLWCVKIEIITNVFPFENMSICVRKTFSELICVQKKEADSGCQSSKSVQTQTRHFWCCSLCVWLLWLSHKRAGWCQGVHVHLVGNPST